ncbi:YdgA family protein [Aggregatibacter actinomycetemcomitans]|uniref:YdgA family protein n=1 Tax=Aggregatibacter actinomycetemcomitans TaxID=714 RepID=UPI00215A1151|nr:YdgA family protein [Aggregatibacter actinomycetemcomitans]
MSKKRKVTLTLAAIIVAIGSGAQIYTNQQVEQVLQKFPYSLDNQLRLNVTETNNNFFSRHLTFSLENPDGKTTDVISAKLTALPFFITAESKLSDQLVHQLNKNLNITIDKNTINSKFSPMGDYLQSYVLTGFRDFTNKSQNLAVTLNFNAENKDVNIKTDLSGFNYDKNSKLEQINGQFHFVPVGDNQYDISSIELNIKNAELNLMNGENTKIQLKSAKYQFDIKKNEEAQQRDLTTKFSSDILRVANKERPTEESQTTINGLSLNLTQQGVKSAVDFADEFKKLTNDNQGIKNAVNFLVAVLTQNEELKGSLTVKSVEAPKNQKPYFNLNDTTFSLKMDNRHLDNADINLQLNVGNVKQTPEDQNKQWQAKGAKIIYHLENYNLENELAFIPFYLDSFTVKTPPKEDNKVLLKLKEKWAKESGGNSNAEIALQSFNYGNVVSENLSVKSQSMEENHQYRGASTLSMQKLALPEAQIQIEDLAVSLPLTVNNYPKLAEAQFCSGLAAPLCSAYFTSETIEKYIENQWKGLDLSIDNSTITLNLNTYPGTKAYPLKLDINGAIKSQQDNQTPLDTLDQNLRGSLSITLNKGLIDDTNEQSLKIKNDSPFWQQLQMEIKPEDTLSPLFLEDKDNYVIKLEKTDKGTFINGKTEEEIRQEILKQTEEVEPQEEAEEIKPQVEIPPQSEGEKQEAVQPNQIEKPNN